MIQFDEHTGRFQDLPAVLLVGRLYQNRSTGILEADFPGGDVRLWFKRGWLCHSAGAEDTRLGLFVAPGDDRGLRRALRRQQADGKLLGQHLIATGVLTPSGLEVALERQLGARLARLITAREGSFRFEEGMAGFGCVPLSAHLANPLSLAAEALDSLSAQDLFWVEERLGNRTVRLSPGRRVPPAFRVRDRDDLLGRLLDWQEGAHLCRSARGLRLAAGLLGFGYLSTERTAGLAEEGRVPPRPVEAPGPAPEAGALRPVVLQKLSLLRSGGTWYELLGVSPLASSRELKARYRGLALHCHPDRVEASLVEPARVLFSELAHAYRSLVDDALRLEYDRTMVLGGDWRRHGTADELEGLFVRRADEQMAAGRVPIASEYQRLAAELGRIRRRLTLSEGGIRLPAVDRVPGEGQPTGLRRE